MMDIPTPPPVAPAPPAVPERAGMPYKASSVASFLGKNPTTTAIYYPSNPKAADVLSTLTNPLPDPADASGKGELLVAYMDR